MRITPKFGGYVAVAQAVYGHEVSPYFHNLISDSLI